MNKNFSIPYKAINLFLKKYYILSRDGSLVRTLLMIVWLGSYLLIVRTYILLACLTNSLNKCISNLTEN